MKKKNRRGFFLSETIVVIAIVTIALLGTFRIFSTVYSKYKESENYDTATATNVVTSIKKYYTSVGFDYNALLNGNFYVDLTNSTVYDSEYYDQLKNITEVENIYLFDMEKLFTNNNINTFNSSLRKYLKTFQNNDKVSILLVVVLNGGEYGSVAINTPPTVTLVGDSSNEYAVIVPLNGTFTDPGYTNWDGDAPTTEWETALDTSKEGIYYLHYDFDGYLLRRKVIVIKNEYNYSYTGNLQIFTAKMSGWYKVELWGAQSGNSGTGYGAYTLGNAYMNANEKYYIYVGGVGSSSGVTGTGGGYNGGGNAGTVGTSRGGGGATDIRLASGSWNDATGLNSRIMVAAGGGAGENNLGGVGGGLTGGPNNAGTYSTQISGSAFGYATTPSIDSSGAGGGYYGGVLATADSAAAGGGSSFISGYAGVNAIASSSSTNPTNNTIHYSGKYFKNGSMTPGTNSGNGKAKITFISDSEPTRTNIKLNSVRYIKDCVNGSSTNTSNHWVELQAIYNGINVAYGKTVTGTGTENTSFPFTNIVNGDITSANYSEITDKGLQCITVNLGSTYNLDEIAVWHYWADGRTYYSNTTYVSSDNSTWVPVMASVSAETSQGKRVSVYDANTTVTPVYRVSNLVTNGSFENGTTGWGTYNFTMSTSTAYKKNGSYSAPIVTTSASHAQISQNVAIIAGNKYYGRISLLKAATLDNSGQYDIIGFTSGEMDFATSDNTTIPNTSQWYDLSNIVSGIETKTAELRKYTFSKVPVYTDAYILINLTSTFGSGKEPNKAWCDANLDYFDGSQNLNLTI